MLYKEISDEFIEEVTMYINEFNVVNRSSDEWLLKLLQLLNENKDMTIIILADDSENRLLEFVLSKVKKEITFTLNNMAIYDDSINNLFFLYFTKGSISVIKEWLTHYPELPAETIKNILIQLRQGDILTE